MLIEDLKPLKEKMKICICSTGPDLNSQISPVFGRSPYFLIYDLDTEKFKAIPNPSFQMGRGAGVAAFQMVVSEKVSAVICGNFGPNAFSLLQMAGVKIYSGIFGLTVSEVIEKFKKGELKETRMPSVPGHFGLGPQRRRLRRRLRRRFRRRGR